jgi:hypothetical protein
MATAQAPGRCHLLPIGATKTTPVDRTRNTLHCNGIQHRPVVTWGVYSLLRCRNSRHWQTSIWKRPKNLTLGGLDDRYAARATRRR